MTPAEVAEGAAAGSLLARAARFGVVGLSATALYFGLGWSFHRAGLAIEAASLAAQVLSLVYSYLLQKTFTFGVRGHHRRFGPRFLTATAGLVGVAHLLVWGLDELGAGGTTALLANCVFYPAASFLVHGFWTFAAPEPARSRG